MLERDWLNDLYQRHRRPLFLAAWNLLHCPSLAEDAVHSAFARLAKLGDPPADPKLYAFRAVRNAAIDLVKARARRREQPIDSEMEGAGAELPAAEEPLAAIVGASEQPDASAREVVELHLHGQLTFQEIAILLDQPLPTVASRYRRTLEKLRQALQVCHE